MSNERHTLSQDLLESADRAARGENDKTASEVLLDVEILQRRADQRMRNETRQHLKELVRAVENDPPHIGVLSTGERCAVALILDKPELLRRGDTMLYAAHRVGTHWLEACWEVQRDGWR